MNIDVVVVIVRVNLHTARCLESQLQSGDG